MHNSLKYSYYHRIITYETIDPINNGIHHKEEAINLPKNRKKERSFSLHLHFAKSKTRDNLHPSTAADLQSRSFCYLRRSEYDRSATATATAAKKEGGLGLNFAGLVLVHPFFGTGRPDKVWEYVCSDSAGPDDFRLHPMAYPDLLSSLGCGRVLVCLAEKDFLKNRGLSYYQCLKKSSWNGVVEIFETAGEPHVFHLIDPTRGGASPLMARIAEFINAGVRVLSHV